MNESIPKQLPRRKPMFGAMAIVSLCTSGCLYLYFILHLEEWMNKLAVEVALTQGRGGGHDNRIDPVQFVFNGLMLFWVLGVVFAVIGIVRRERPRWPALAALILGIIPLTISLTACLFSNGQGLAH